MISIPTDLRACFFGCAATVLSRDEQDLFRDANPVGFILFGRNIETPSQLAQLCTQLRDAVGWHCPILIDQEGGRVARMAAPHWDEFPPALDMAHGPDPQRAFWIRGRLIADQLQQVGINVNCAPVLDIARDQTHPILRNRCYGTSVRDVVQNAKAMVAGQAAGGVISVAKHIPGHGRATSDSHMELPHVAAGAHTLWDTDFKAFQDCNDIVMGMTAHILFDELDADAPATQSPKMINLIRNDIGFGGFLMTDDISMQALSGTVVDRGARALQAGCDAVLHCGGDFGEMTALSNALPVLTQQAAGRLQVALTDLNPFVPVDIADLKEEFATLLGS